MIEPYLSFHGNAAKAIHFYEKVFDCNDTKIIKFSEIPPNPNHPVTEENKDWIAFCQLTICGTRLSISDSGGNKKEQPGDMISLMIRLEDMDQTKEIYQRLIEHSEILMELQPQFFAQLYAKVKDQFGIEWQLICEKKDHSI